MSENSKIEWTDHTFNPWEGCQKVGPGCDHCYAETRNARYAGGTAINWGPGAPRRRTSAANWRKPVSWNAAHTEFFAAQGRRQRVFCASLADVFDNAVDLLWRRDLFRLIDDTPNLDWLLLTKRIGNVPTMLRHIGVKQLPDNVWLGATIVNQEEADRDIPKLLAVPAHVRFLSMEPLLGSVDISRWIDPTGVHCIDVCPDSSYVDVDTVERAESTTEDMPLCPHCGEVASWTGYDDGVDWVIVGGESGPGARPMHPAWTRDLRDQCSTAGVPFLFKQWGEWTPGENVERQTGVVDTADLFAGKWMFGKENLANYGHVDDEPDLYRIGKKAAGRHLDGRTHDEFPQALA